MKLVIKSCRSDMRKKGVRRDTVTTLSGDCGQTLPEVHCSGSADITEHHMILEFQLARVNDIIPLSHQS